MIMRSMLGIICVLISGCAETNTVYVPTPIHFIPPPATLPISLPRVKFTALKCNSSTAYAMSLEDIKLLMSGLNDVATHIELRAAEVAYYQDFINGLSKNNETK